MEAELNEARRTVQIQTEGGHTLSDVRKTFIDKVRVLEKELIIRDCEVKV